MITLADITAKVSAEILATHDTQAITDAFNSGRTKIVSREGGIGTIMNALGPDGGAALLDRLEILSATNPAVKWGMKLILAGTFDFGLPSSRAMIDQLVPDPERTALKALAEVPDEIGTHDIENILNEVL